MRHTLITLGALVWVSVSSSAQTLLPPDASTALEALESSPRTGSWVEVTRAGAPPVRTWVVYPEGSEKAPAVVLIHGNRGIVDWIRVAADRLAAAGSTWRRPPSSRILSWTHPLDRPYRMLERIRKDAEAEVPFLDEVRRYHSSATDSRS